MINAALIFSKEGLIGAVVAAICVAISVVIAGILKKRLNLRVSGGYRNLLLMLSPLFSPLLALFFLFIAATGAAEQVYGKLAAIPAALQLVLAWLVIELVKIFSHNKTVTIGTAVILFSIAALSILGILDLVASYLDAYALNLGGVRISLLIILKFAVALFVLLWAAKGFTGMFEAYINGLKNLRKSTKELFSKIANIVIYFIVFIIVLDIAGVDLTALAVFSGAVGVGVGLGLQKIASNFISGFTLLMDKSIEVDDLIELESGFTGYVRHINARFTLIEAPDGKEIMIPNENIISQRLTNWTYSNTRGRVEIKIGVAYNSDLEKAKKLMLEAAKEHERCIADPEPVCYMREFGDSSINFVLFFWVENVIDGRFGPQSDVMLSVWKKFKENNIEIPFPQRDVYIKNTSVFKE